MRIPANPYSPANSLPVSRTPEAVKFTPSDTERVRRRNRPKFNAANQFQRDAAHYLLIWSWLGLLAPRAAIGKDHSTDANP